MRGKPNGCKVLLHSVKNMSCLLLHSLKIKFYSSTILQEAWACKKKIKAISMSVCGLCEMLLLCICATSESCSCLSRVLTPPRGGRCYFKFTVVEQIFLSYDKSHFDSLSPIYSKPPFHCFLCFLPCMSVTFLKMSEFLCAVAIYFWRRSRAQCQTCCFST